MRGHISVKMVLLGESGGAGESCLLLLGNQRRGGSHCGG